MSTPITHELKHESLRLLREYQQTSSPEIRNQLVHLNFGLVRKEAHHWVNQCSESYEDLLQVGCLGLIRAIERFDTTKGSAFSSFAIPYMVPDPRYRSFQLAQEDRIRLQQALAKLEKRTRDVLEFVFLHDLTQKEVAERLDISVVTVSRRVKKGLDSLKKFMSGSEH
jgi:RNA polymerase sigma-B factor